MMRRRNGRRWSTCQLIQVFDNEAMYNESDVISQYVDVTKRTRCRNVGCSLLR